MVGLLEAKIISPDDPEYPPGIEEALDERPTITARGNLGLLTCKPLALFCSVKCPGDIILRLYDLIRSVRDAGIPVISGFHSPMEKECLTLLLRGSQPIIICPARSIEEMRLPGPWKKPIAERRLLILSPFTKRQRRMTAGIARMRNLFVAGLADQILVAHAEPRGKTESFFLRLLTLNKHLWTMASEDNQNLIASGARVFTPENVSFAKWP